jgi:hypothetical protein
MTTSMNMKQRIAARGKSGQKFIARNRAPRVQIEYDVEVYGSEKEDPAALRNGRDGGSIREAR